jgi:signal transduction histidine kinase
VSTREDIWQDRLEALIPAIPFVMLALSTVAGTVFDTRQAAGPTLALAAAALAWLIARPKLPAPVYVSGLVAFSLVFVTRSPLFGFFIFTVYLSVDDLPGWWKVPPLFITAVLSGICQVGGWPLQEWASWPIVLAVVFVNVFVGGSMFAAALIAEERSRQREEMEREAGVLQERQRLAREIHDTIAQDLTGIVAQLEAAAQARRAGADDSGYLDAAMTLARGGLTEARRSVRAIGPGELEGARLPDALAKVAGGWSQRSGVPAAFTTTGTPRTVHPDVEVTLLRAAQEALANVARHARATRVGLTLSYMEDLVTLDVRDDGVGFEPSRTGFGLTGMRQRVQGVGGALAVESAPGEGTAISASVPV